MPTNSVVRQHRVQNWLQTALLLVSLTGVLALTAFLIGGPTLAWIAVVIALGSFALAPAVSPAIVLRMYRARAIPRTAAPALHDVSDALAARAGLRTPPELFYVPSSVMNAFTVGSPSDAAIALSDGILRRMSLDEIAAIVAHEITHIRNRDTRTMAFADTMGRVTSGLSSLGLLLLFLNLPLILLGVETISFIAIIVLVFSPTVSSLIQLALSRTREFDADLGAARLLGDPRPLIAALRKLELQHGSILRRLFLPVQRLPEPSLLRTHPPTDERIARLELVGGVEPPPAQAPSRFSGSIPVRMLAPGELRPRRHRTGAWF